MSDATPDRTAPASAGSKLFRDLAIFTAARLLLVAAIAGIILGIGKIVDVEIPGLVALIFAIVIALPLSMVLFAGLRRRVNESIAAVDERRRRDKADLRAKLRGEDRTAEE
ncbi:DUF4229 domain-containing protein [Antrihabitans sp. YC2-6]|uniref:DUF4229 domain-containing protein n=1 Tax=Antrihabitans sp. YC2-6 TaxID=2799498 RepID=UPI0018F3A5DF|nr:DUF4229 domain-containing protein [Antrihabitans sp. YC2-6]MBJ8347904.1 DUF4229 domain-containing protein [Antrihabitans sp. YC2-6]